MTNIPVELTNKGFVPPINKYEMYPNAKAPYASGLFFKHRYTGIH